MLINTLTRPATNSLITQSFIQGIAKPAGDVRKIFHKDTSTMAVDRKRIKELDSERLAGQKVEGQSSPQKRIAEGYHKEIIRKTISYTVKLTGEALENLTDRQLVTEVTDVSTGIINKIELDMRNFIGLGFGTSYTDNEGFIVDTTTGDGLSFFNTLHTLTESTDTYSNILSGAPSLSEDALEGAEDYFAYNVLDNFGARASMKPNAIITADKATMKNRVRRLIDSKSPEKIEGVSNSNSGVTNVYKGRAWQHLVVEFDVDAKDKTNSALSFYWFLASIGGSAKTSLQAYYVSWKSPMVAPSEINQDKWTLSFTARALYGIGAVSGRGMLASKATS